MIATVILNFQTKEGEARNITEEVQDALQRTDLQSGLVTVFVSGGCGRSRYHPVPASVEPLLGPQSIPARIQLW